MWLPPQKWVLKLKEIFLVISVFSHWLKSPWKRGKLMPADPEWRQNRIESTEWIQKKRTSLSNSKLPRYLFQFTLCFAFIFSTIHNVLVIFLSVFPVVPLLHAQNIPLILTCNDNQCYYINCYSRRRSPTLSSELINHNNGSSTAPLHGITSRILSNTLDMFRFRPWIFCFSVSHVFCLVS